MLLLYSCFLMISCRGDNKGVSSPVTEKGSWFSEKFWCHRVNTIEKVHRVGNKCRGLEIDLFFLDDTLFVKHDEEDSAKLTLPQLMSAIQDSEFHYYWFDLKNIDENNSKAFSSALIAVIKDFSSIGNCVVESWMPSCMKIFVDAGCHTSFFINLSGMNTDEDVKVRIDNITEYVTKYKISAISSVEADYAFMNKYFPHFNKLTWYTGTNRSYIDSLVAHINNDITMQVCLLEESVLR